MNERLCLSRLGTRKLYFLLKSRFQVFKIKLGWNSLFNVLRSANMLIKPRRPYHKTTNSHHRFRKHPILLAQWNIKTRIFIEKPRDLEQARLMIAESIEAYNTMRSHLSLQYKTPDVVHQASINRL